MNFAIKRIVPFSRLPRTPCFLRDFKGEDAAKKREDLLKGLTVFVEDRASHGWNRLRLRNLLQSIPVRTYPHLTGILNPMMQEPGFSDSHFSRLISHFPSSPPEWDFINPALEAARLCRWDAETKFDFCRRWFRAIDGVIDRIRMREPLPRLQQGIRVLRMRLLASQRRGEEAAVLIPLALLQASFSLYHEAMATVEEAFERDRGRFKERPKVEGKIVRAFAKENGFAEYQADRYYPDKLPEWQLAWIQRFRDADSSSSPVVEEPLELPLSALVPIHYLATDERKEAKQSPSHEVIHKIRGIRDMMLYLLSTMDWAPGMRPTDGMLKIILRDQYDPYHKLPRVSRPVDGRRLLIDGQTRIAALSSLVEDRLFPKDTFSRPLPFDSADRVDPYEELFIVFQARSMTVPRFGFLDMMRYSSRAVALFREIGATADLTSFQPPRGWIPPGWEPSDTESDA